MVTDMETILPLQTIPIIVPNILEILIKIDMVVEILMLMVGPIRTQLQFSQLSHGMFRMVQMLSIQIPLSGLISILMGMEIIGTIHRGMKVGQ